MREDINDFDSLFGGAESEADVNAADDVGDADSNADILAELDEELGAIDTSESKSETKQGRGGGLLGGITSKLPKLPKLPGKFGGGSGDKSGLDIKSLGNQITKVFSNIPFPDTEQVVNAVKSHTINLLACLLALVILLPVCYIASGVYLNVDLPLINKFRDVTVYALDSARAKSLARQWESLTVWQKPEPVAPKIPTDKLARLGADASAADLLCAIFTDLDKASVESLASSSDTLNQDTYLSWELPIDDALTPTRLKTLEGDDVVGFYGTRYTMVVKRTTAVGTSVLIVLDYAKSLNVSLCADFTYWEVLKEHAQHTDALAFMVGNSAKYITRGESDTVGYGQISGGIRLNGVQQYKPSDESLLVGYRDDGELVTGAMAERYGWVYIEGVRVWDGAKGGFINVAPKPVTLPEFETDADREAYELEASRLAEENSRSARGVVAQRVKDGVVTDMFIAGANVSDSELSVCIRDYGVTAGAETVRGDSVGLYIDGKYVLSDDTGLPLQGERCMLAWVLSRAKR